MGKKFLNLSEIVLNEMNSRPVCFSYLNVLCIRIFHAFKTWKRTPFSTTFSRLPPALDLLSVRMVFPATVVMWRMDGRSESVPDSHAPTLPDNYGVGCARPTCGSANLD